MSSATFSSIRAWFLETAFFHTAVKDRDLISLFPAVLRIPDLCEVRVHSGDSRILPSFSKALRAPVSAMQHGIHRRLEGMSECALPGALFDIENCSHGELQAMSVQVNHYMKS